MKRTIAEDFALKPIVSAKSRRRESNRKASDKIGDGSGYVYFMQHTGGGPVKIGRSKRPGARIANVSRAKFGGGDELRYIGWLKVKLGVEVRLERALHERFADKRLDGEWFDINGAADLSEILATARSVVGDGFTLAGLGGDEDEDDNNRVAMTRAEAMRVMRGRRGQTRY